MKNEKEAVDIKRMRADLAQVQANTRKTEAETAKLLAEAESVREQTKINVKYAGRREVK